MTSKDRVAEYWRRLCVDVGVPPFAPSVSDGTTRERGIAYACTLADMIRAAWREAGHDVDVRIERDQDGRVHIRSDLVSGLPRPIWERAWARWCGQSPPEDR